ncbi:conserved hypothetical protein [Paecilomyces variotii No. 5]|uniref:Phosphoserine phosphatase n=1 Tax=Byssochlamys spectabilis (strain No. 5 / NBRC 109023) TaxID=1356009 RepID=V5G0E1_BYSSN|nr:conserved hypothetical protein [Paecilomyces variotii No. 5]
MGSIAQDLPYVKTNPKVIFFTDFDGTITIDDSNDYLSDNLGFGVEKRRALNMAVIEGRMPFRDMFQQMLEHIETPFDQCIDILKKNMKLDPGFKAFYEWAKEHNVPIVILSSGMVPIIKALIEVMLGEETDNLTIVANEVEGRHGKDINSVGGWQIRYRDDSSFGHDKSLEIKPYAALPRGQRPTLLYAGDGVSDLSAARETDLLFAKEGKDLVLYCQREGVPYTTFRDWSTILATTKRIYDGATSTERIAKEASAAHFGNAAAVQV